MRIIRLIVLISALGFVTYGAPIVYSVAGDNTTASLTSILGTFRSDIGGANNGGAIGSQASGRREINWDGGALNSLESPLNMPGDFFNITAPRGVVFSTPGTGVQVSQNAGAGRTVEFGNLTPGLEINLAAFSPQRLFGPVGSNITDVEFRAAGLSIPATVTAFGVIFTDVDFADTTSMQFFDLGGSSLGTFYAPVGLTLDESFSFLGVRFNAGEQVGRVRITTGLDNLDLGGTGDDFVAMDDFIFSEPQAVPEPVSILLTGGALLAIGILRRRRASL